MRLVGKLLLRESHLTAWVEFLVKWWLAHGKTRYIKERLLG